jgi:hypothetical protein
VTSQILVVLLIATVARLVAAPHYYKPSDVQDDSKKKMPKSLPPRS